MTEPLDHSSRDIEEQLRFETLLAELSARFINLPADRVDSEIEDAQRRICDCLGFDIAVLWQWEADAPDLFTLTHHYRRVDGPPLTRQLQAAESFPWGLRQVQAGKSFLLSSMDDVPEGAERDRESYLYYGVKNASLLPLSVGGGAPFGAITFHDAVTPRAWTETLVKRLELVAQAFANAIVRKRSELALRESEARLSLATEAAGAGPWVLDARGERFWVTPKIMELFGLPPGDVLDVERFIELIHPDDRQGVRGAMAEAVQSREMRVVEYRVVRTDGQVRWVQSRGRLCGEAESARLMGITSDITERRQAAESLARANRQNELILDSTAEGILGVDLRGSHTFVNPAAGRMLGYSPDELVGRSGHSIWHHSRADGNAYPEDECPICITCRDGVEHHVTSDVFWRKEGTCFPVEYTCTPIMEHGRRLGVVITFEDITRRKESEKALRESGTRMAAALEVAELGSYEVLNNVRVTFVDRRACEILGLSEADQKAGRVLEFWMEHIHPEDRPHVMEVRRVMEEAGRDQMTVDYRFLNPARGTLHVHHLAHVLERDAAGLAVRTIGVLQDVTERRQMELNAIQSRQELTRVSRVATMGELVASLAHELNQPLTAIMSNAQAAQRLLTSGKPDLGEIREILADIVADDHRAGEVIGRVRSLLKKGHAERKSIDMNAVIREVLGLLRTNAILKGVSVASELSPDPLPVLGDRIQLQQVLMNLVLNAFDAMPSGSGGAREVVVRSRRSEAEGVLVMVRDSGSGIPPANMPRVFEPFFTSKPDGMGMGLSICRSIIEKHGGRIWAENNPGRGATFQFALPIAEGERGEGRGAREEGRGARDEGVR